MLCLRCPRGIDIMSKSSITSKLAQSSAFKASTRRFTSFRGPSRPTLFPSLSAFRSSFSPTPITGSATVSEGTIDLLPKISAHPALGATQIRCGPRNTFSPSHFVRKRRHGFLSRIRTRKGRMTLQRRRLKRRSTLSH